MAEAGSKEDSTSVPANNTTAMLAPYAVTQKAPSDDDSEEVKMSMIIVLYIRIHVLNELTF
jgi:hypothetical protein